MSPSQLRRAARRLVLNAPFSLPRPVQRAIAGRPIVRDGQTLDTQMQVVSKFLAAVSRDPATRPLSRVRAEFDAMSMAMDQGGPAMARTVEVAARGPGGAIPLTLLVPHGVGPKAPAIVYFHGGGFCVGARHTHAGLAARIAEGAKAIVINVEYRLAPEHPFPGAVEDALEAYRWVLENGAAHGIDTNRVAVAGDSAGGCLSAVVSVLARDSGLTLPRAQWLIYPITESSGGTPSRSLFADGFLLDSKTLAWFTSTYLQKKEVEDPRASPLRTPSLAGLPPAFVQTAGFDPLRDEGEEYAARLEREGVTTRHRRYPGLIHGFANLDFSATSQAAIAEGIIWVREALR